MNLFKRITASVTGSIESAVCQLENHEAVVHAALKDTRRLAAKAKVRMARVQKDGVALQQKLQSLQTEEQRWADRAITEAECDEESALECLRRRNRAREQIVATEEALRIHAEQEKRLVETVASIEERLQEIESTRNMLRTRQSTAEATTAVSHLESDSTTDLDDVIERWEMRILESEYANPPVWSTDSFAARFKTQEDSDSLKAQLDELLNKENKK